jgi:hypothetical protein
MLYTIPESCKKTMDFESSVPLNDDDVGVGFNNNTSLKRSNSHGSNKDLQAIGDGMENSLEYRIHTTDATTGKKISLWHDVSLIHIDPETKQETPYMNFVCEIPKFSRYVFYTRSIYFWNSTNMCACL